MRLESKCKNFILILFEFRFRGGLDVMNNDTGVHSIYTVYDNSEIMFHVSTLLPHSSVNEQQLERKRHIGNDRVTIVFQDEDTPFSPKMIKSKLLHVFIIIQPYKINNLTEFYKVILILFVISSIFLYISLLWFWSNYFYSLLSKINLLFLTIRLDNIHCICIIFL